MCCVMVNQFKNKQHVFRVVCEIIVWFMCIVRVGGISQCLCVCACICNVTCMRIHVIWVYSVVSVCCGGVAYVHGQCGVVTQYNDVCMMCWCGLLQTVVCVMAKC